MSNIPSLIRSLSILSMLALVACDVMPHDPDFSPSASISPAREGGGQMLPRFPELASTITQVDLGIEYARPEMDDEALIRAVRETEGRVFIGFKPAGARRTSETGIIPAITRAEALEGREVVAWHPHDALLSSRLRIGKRLSAACARGPLRNVLFSEPASFLARPTVSRIRRSVLEPA